MQQPGTTRTRSVLRACAALCLLLLAACDNTLDPFVPGTLAEPFYVYGFLDTAADTQFVRVEPIRRTTERPGTLPEGVTVTTEEAESGVQAAWQDSLVRLDDGSLGFLYYSTAPVQGGRTYVLTIRGPDAAASRAATSVPPRPEGQVDSVEVIGLTIQQRVIWKGLQEAPAEAEALYRVAPAAGMAPIEVAVPYDQRGELAEEGWALSLFLRSDLFEVRQALGLTEDDTNAILCAVGLRVRRHSTEWALPADQTTVTNGRGFFGSVGTYTVIWEPEPRALRLLGFQPCGPS